MQHRSSASTASQPAATNSSWQDPGSSKATFQSENRTLLDWPTDVTEAADLLDIDRYRRWPMAR
jgi:hypothetical protein